MRPLRTLLLVNLGLFTAASALLVSAVVLTTGDRRAGMMLALAAGAASLILVFVIGGWLVKRAILAPLDEPTRTSEPLVEGVGAGRERPPLGAEFQTLEERFHALSQRLVTAEEALVRAERHAAIGRLSAGLALEIRDPLGMLRRSVEALSERGVDAGTVAAMQLEVARMEKIAAGLLDYSRVSRSPRAPADLAAAARASVDLLTKQGALKGHGVELVADPDVPPVGADPHDLEQILVNLILNARDARPGGRIVVGVHRHLPGAQRRHSDEYDLGRGNRRQETPAPSPTSGEAPGNGTLLIVADEGEGVPEADRLRIFDPFFTTKGAAGGAGLGLAIVARAVHDAGGVVWVDRAREGGAVIKALFPAVAHPS